MRNALICFFIMAFALAAARGLAAQTAGQAGDQSPIPVCDPLTGRTPDGANCDPALHQAPTPAGPEDSDSHPMEDPSTGRGAAVRYAPALNGGDPIVMPQPVRLRYMFGSGATQGFDSAAAGTSGSLPSGVSILDGYAAASVQNTKSFLLLQHATTFTHYSAEEIQGQMFNRTSVLAAGDFSQRLNWNIEGQSTLGDDALRLVNPLPERMVGQFSTAEPVTAAYGIDQGKIWGGGVSGSLNWKPASDRTVTLTVRNSYHHRFFDDLNSNITTGRIEYVKAQTDRTSLGFFGQTVHGTGEIACDSSGGGVQFQSQVTESTLMELSAGPEFSSTGCGRRQAFSLHAAVAGAVNSSTRIYANANREFSNGYVRRGTWEDNVVVGVGKRFSRQFSWSADAGYVKGTLISSVLTYQGYFASTELRKRLSEGLTAVATYRRFDHSVSSQGVRRNVVMVSLQWTPSRHSAHRSDPYATVRQQESAPGEQK